MGLAMWHGGAAPTLAALVALSAAGLAQSAPRALQTTGGRDSVPFLSCQTQNELFANGIGFISGVCCSQSGELCSDEGFQFPDTCTTLTCAQTVHRVAVACQDFVKGSTFFSGQQAMIDTVSRTCNAPGGALSPAFDMPPVRSLASLSGSAATDVCGVTLVEALPGEHRSAAPLTALFTASQTKVFQLDFDQLWCASGEVLTLYDGADDAAPILASFSGTSLPASPPRTSSRHLFVKLSTTHMGEASGFSMRLSCVCNSESCGQHGRCDHGQCQCEDGYTGDLCDTATLPPPPPPGAGGDATECDQCRVGFSCVGETGPCWPDAVHFGTEEDAVQQPSASSGSVSFFGVYQRTESTCDEAPVFKLDDAFDDGAGNMRPSFLYQRLGTWEGYWVVSVGDASQDYAVVDCSAPRILFDASACPLDSTPGHPFATPEHKGEGCLDHWRQCLLDSSADPTTAGCAPPPSNVGWGDISDSITMSVQLPVGHTECTDCPGGRSCVGGASGTGPCWPDSVSLAGTMLASSNSQFAGKFASLALPQTRRRLAEAGVENAGDMVCEGAPVYVLQRTSCQSGPCEDQPDQPPLSTFLYRRPGACVPNPLHSFKPEWFTDVCHRAFWQISRQQVDDSGVAAFNCSDYSMAAFHNYLCTSAEDIALESLSDEELQLRSNDPTVCDGYWSECTSSQSGPCSAPLPPGIEQILHGNPMAVPEPIGDWEQNRDLRMELEYQKVGHLVEGLNNWANRAQAALGE